MIQLHRVCIVLTVGLLAAAPVVSFAQLQPNGGDKAGSQQSPNWGGSSIGQPSGWNPYGGNPGGGFDRGYGVQRYDPQTHGYAENRADTAWNRGDRRTACRWATQARDRPGWTNDRTTDKARQYCSEDKPDSSSQSSAGA